MLIYLTGTENIKKIENSIYEIQMENTIPIGEPIKSNSIDLLQEVKSNLCKNKDLNLLIIDLSVITNSDSEVITAIKNLRFFNNSCRFIILALDRVIGDPLLSEIVDMGIYNIIIDEDEMLSKIKFYVLNNGTYKEASIFQNKEEDSKEKKHKKIKNTKAAKIEHEAKKNNQKVILKTLKSKIIISVIGTQSRIGVTHTSILLAYNLMKKGYRVAVIENNNHNDFSKLQDCYETTVYSNITSFLKIYQIDFYTNTDKDLLSKIVGLDYDYIIMDNGSIAECDIIEHNRADVKIVVFGAKAWEQQYLGRILELGEEVISNYRFFTICDEKTKKDILDEMDSLQVYFLNFKPEPFSEDPSILNIMNGFLYEEKEKKKSIFSKFLK